MQILVVTACHEDNYGPDLLYKTISVNDDYLEKALEWVNKKYATEAFEDNGWDDFKFEKDSVYTEYQSTFYIDNQLCLKCGIFKLRMPATFYECWTKP